MSEANAIQQDSGQSTGNALFVSRNGKSKSLNDVKAVRELYIPNALEHNTEVWACRKVKKRARKFTTLRRMAEHKTCDLGTLAEQDELWCTQHEIDLTPRFWLIRSFSWAITETQCGFMMEQREWTATAYQLTQRDWHGRCSTTQSCTRPELALHFLKFGRMFDSKKIENQVLEVDQPRCPEIVALAEHSAHQMAQINVTYLNTHAVVTGMVRASRIHAGMHMALANELKQSDEGPWLGEQKNQGPLRGRTRHYNHNGGAAEHKTSSHSLQISGRDTPWISNIVLVQKKDGGLRPCIDFRKLNEVTVPNHFPLPRLEVVLEKVGNCHWYTSLDLPSGFLQIRLTERASRKCGIITEDDVFQMAHMPIGLRNATSAFARVMAHVLSGLEESVIVYVVDFRIYTKSPDFKEHLDALRQVFVRLKQYDLKVSPKRWRTHDLKKTLLKHGPSLRIRPRIRLEALHQQTRRDG
uniref:Reverse transcriptase domain-containing protein n=1 Tax=Globodera pallida TaxID=36090 RepID=A0A183C893_GLOPA